MAKEIDEYGDRLFADLIKVDTLSGKITIYPQRTNNILARLLPGFRALVSHKPYRKKSSMRSKANRFWLNPTEYVAIGFFICYISHNLAKLQTGVLGMGSSKRSFLVSIGIILELATFITFCLVKVPVVLATDDAVMKIQKESPGEIPKDLKIHWERGSCNHESWAVYIITSRIG